VFTAIKNLEGHLGLKLLDRKGYPVKLTGVGRSFHEQMRHFLNEYGVLRGHAKQLVMGEETELHVVVGDICPLRETLALLRRFFTRHSSTRLHLHFEAISGPWERLFDDEADLIIHHINKSDTRLEYIDLFSETVLPVVAPQFLPFPITRTIRPEQMRDHVQCVVRSTARHSPDSSYFLVDGARTWTVSDQLMKKEVILQGMGWGHMPAFLIASELREGKLLSIAGKYLRGGAGDIVAARRRDRPHGPVAKKLWKFIRENAPALRAAVAKAAGKRGASRR